MDHQEFKRINQIIASREFQYQFASEEELIHRIVGTSDSRFNGLLFENLVRRPFSLEEFKEITSYKVAINVLRSDFGFKDDKKPGDFDILVLPMVLDKPSFERLCAIEVKVARPIRLKPNKSSKSMGSKQVKGLIEDGFPYIGLIHISMPEPLKGDEIQTLTHVYMDSKKKNRGEVELPFDYFSWATSENQMNRMKALDLPEFIGINSLGINASKIGGYLINYHMNHTEDELASYNPYAKKETLDLAKSFFSDPDNYFLQYK